MEKYRDYNTDELMRDERFRAWVFSGREEDRFWSEFLKRYPEKKNVLLTARAALRALQGFDTPPAEGSRERVWNAVREGIGEAAPQQRPAGKWMAAPWQWRAAAACVLAMLGGWLFYRTQFGEKEASARERSNRRIGMIERENASPEKMPVTLPDGSSVVLYPGARLRFPEQGGGARRSVYLQGNGYFQVRRDSLRPFVVYADEVVVQVLGTRFTVLASQRAAAGKVMVETGKVKVHTYDGYRAGGGQADAVILTANQQVTFDPGKRRLVKGIVAAPALVSAPRKYPDFYFRNVPVGEVFRTLERSYGVKIRCNGDALESCNLTAPLGDEPLFRKLDVICQTIGATYEVWGTEIVVTGKGCPD